MTLPGRAPAGAAPASRPAILEGPSSEQTAEGDFPDFLKAGPGLIVWLIALALGGGVLAEYYGTIGYMPDIEWKSSLTYIGAATLIGAGIGVLFSLSVFFPAFIWSQSLVHCTNLEGTFCDETDNESDVRIWEVFKLLGAPFGIVLAITHALPPKGALVAALTAAILLLVTADRLNRLSTQLMGLYGFGSGQEVDLALTDEGVEIVKKLGLAQPGSPEKLSGAAILSRLGSEYFLSMGGKTFILPKNAVSSWQRDVRRPNNQAPTP